MIHPEPAPDTPNLEPHDTTTSVPIPSPESVGPLSILDPTTDGSSPTAPPPSEETIAFIVVPDRGALMDSMSTMQTQPVNEDAAPSIIAPDTGVLMDSMSTMQTQPTD